LKKTEEEQVHWKMKMFEENGEDRPDIENQSFPRREVLICIRKRQKGKGRAREYTADKSGLGLTLLLLTWSVVELFLETFSAFTSGIF